MLADACASFRAQSWKTKELVVVNDGAPLEAVGAGVRVVNLGQRATIGDKRNAGVEAARGEYLATWDDDDFSLPGRLLAQVAELRAHRAAWVRSTQMWLADEALRVHALIATSCWPTMLVRKESVRAVGGYQSRDYMEDALLYMALEEARHPGRHLPAPLYVHRVHATNVSARLAAESMATKLAWAVPQPPAALDAVTREVAALVAKPGPPLLRPAPPKRRRLVVIERR